LFDAWTALGRPYEATVMAGRSLGMHAMIHTSLMEQEIERPHGADVTAVLEGIEYPNLNQLMFSCDEAGS
jgi:hypothetical protein